MKTKDGKDLKLNHYYFLVNGQCVILNDFATRLDGTTVYIVTPFYEGETMEVSGDGGYHHEIIMYYEHEGLPTMVDEIYAEAPMEKLCALYKDKMKSIESLALACGMLQDDINKLYKDKRKLRNEIKEYDKACNLTRDNLKKLKDEYEELNDKVVNAKQKLSEYQDSIPSEVHKEKSTWINKEELQGLNKQAFKLQCLLAGGVDNWEWFDESLKDFRERYPA